MTVAAILLAAGTSTRMGRPKSLLPWGGMTLIEWQVEQLRAAGVEDVIVVVGHEAEAVSRQVGAESARLVVNAHYQEGRASSLRAGAAAAADDVEAVLVLGVDQPRPAWLSRRLIEAWRSQGRPAAVVPVNRGRRGHPVVVAGALLPDLRSASEADLGFRGILNRHKDGVAEVVVDDDVVNVDINTPAEYEAALAKFVR